MMTTPFCSLTTPNELIAYLSSSQRLNNVKCLCKYMKLSTLKNMFESGLMLIKNPEKMNDNYEYKCFCNIVDWNKIAFHSFITRNVESIAMWSMYAQPWEEGIMISIPISVMRKIINTPSNIYEAELNSKGRFEPKPTVLTPNNISLYRVAYTNGSVLTCTGRDDRNFNFKNMFSHPELAGYIKDEAWDYEKEVRLRIDLPESYTQNAVYLKLPDDFFEQIHILTGPRFKGDVKKIIPEKYRHKIQIEESKFTNRIEWIPCDDCKRNCGK